MSLTSLKQFSDATTSSWARLHSQSSHRKWKPPQKDSTQRGNLADQQVSGRVRTSSSLHLSLKFSKNPTRKSKHRFSRSKTWSLNWIKATSLKRISKALRKSHRSHQNPLIVRLNTHHLIKLLKQSFQPRNLKMSTKTRATAKRMKLRQSQLTTSSKLSQKRVSWENST